MTRPAISICIPTFELGGRGIPMLSKLLDTIACQTFKDYEIIISDHSLSDDIRDILPTKMLNIRYFKNERSRGSCEANLNNAISLASGRFIKPMLQDDFFLLPEALELMMGAVTSDNDWVAGGCLHCREDDVTNLFQAHFPQWISDRSLALGQNRIGSPSVVMYPSHVKNKFFDENLLWLMDCELYYRLGNEIGKPKCISKFLHVIRFRHDSISDSQVNDDIRGEEYRYVIDRLDNAEKPLSNYPLMAKRAEELQLNAEIHRRS